MKGGTQLFARAKSVYDWFVRFCDAEGLRSKPLPIPRWLIALIAALIYQAVNLLLTKFAIFAPKYVEVALLASLYVCLIGAGAIQRCNWRHLLVMIGFGLFALLVNSLVSVSGLLAGEGWRPTTWIIDSALIIGVIAVGELFITGHRAWRTCIWVCLVLLGIEAFRLVLQSYLNWIETSFRIDFGRDSYATRYLASILYEPILVVTAWGGLALALIAYKRGWIARVACVFMVFIGFAIHGLFFHHWAFDLSKATLLSDGPFGKRSAVSLLGTRGRSEDMRVLLRAVERADWTEHISTSWDDWRYWAVDYIERDPEFATEAAGLFSRMLREKRSSMLAHASAELLTRYRRVEVAPIILRYALYHQPGGLYGYLEAIEMPERCLVAYLASIDIKYLLSETPRVMDSEWRQVLVEMTGRDMGAMTEDWGPVVDNYIATTRSPLSDELQAEIDDELLCFNHIVEIKNRRNQAYIRLLRKRLEEAGKLEVMETLIERNDDYEGRVRLSFEPRSLQDVQDMEAINAISNQVVEDLRVPEPDYDAPTTGVFNEEIDAYAERVDAMIRQHLPEWVQETTVH